MDLESKIRDSVDILEEFRKAIIESDIVLEEIISGIHKSRRGGHNTEFLEYRSYVEGDDIRFVDWKVYLRSNRFFVKTFEDNKRNSAFLFLDTSRSMFQGSRFIRALLVMTAFAHIFLKMKDEVFLIVNGEKLRVQESGENQLLSVAYEIYNSIHPEKRDFLDLYAGLVESVPKNSIICLFSDLFSNPDEVLKTIQLISGTGTYQYIFHLINRDELDPDKRGLKLFIDPDSEDSIVIQCDNIWGEYKKEINNYVNSINNLIVESGRGRYLLCKEDMSLRDVLTEFFINSRV